MPNPKAQAAKEKGNESFKGGDYPTAVGHYTAAIMADRSDATYPLNRAAAYLKLGKYEDAERDCTTALNITPKNVKALFRRAIARMSLNKYSEAKQDLVDVLKLEPTNPDAQAQLQTLASVLTKELAKQKERVTGTKPTQRQVDVPSATKLATPSPAPASPVPTDQKAPVNSASSPSDAPSSSKPGKTIPLAGQSPKRRRVPIQILGSDGNLLQSAESPRTSPTKVERQPTPDAPNAPKDKLETPSAPSSMGSSDLKPVSSRPLQKPASDRPPEPSTIPSASTSTTATTGSDPAPPPKPATFQDAKQARQSAKPTRVGGGIFRASGQNTIFPTRTHDVSEASTKGKEPADKGPLSSTPPNTSSTPPPPPAQLTPGELELITQLERKPPKTLFDFSRTWASAKSLEARWRVIRTIPAAAFPALCGTSLEPSLLFAILETFLGKLNQQARRDGGVDSLVKEYLDNFSRIPRFGTLVLFFSGPEKGVARQVWARLGVEKPTGVWSSLA